MNRVPLPALLILGIGLLDTRLDGQSPSSPSDPPPPPQGVTTALIEHLEPFLDVPFTREKRAQAVRRLQTVHDAIRILHQLPDHPNHRTPPTIFPCRPWRPLPQLQAPAAASPTVNAPPAPMALADLPFATVVELGGQLQAGHVTSEFLTQLFLDRLERLGPPLHCLVTLTRDRAVAEARQADAELRSGMRRSPLHGIPYAVKDLLDVAGTPTTWGIAARRHHEATRDAEVVRRLREAGAVLVAKLSLGELAMGDVWFEGKTRNPWNPELGSSGSSAGSSAAVAAGLVPFALGSETLGSIVSPATVCGVTGLRPTFGRVPRTGAMNLAESLDKLGPLVRAAADAALVLAVLEGPDGQDPACGEVPCLLPWPQPPGSLRLGVLREDFNRTGEARTHHDAALALIGQHLGPLRPVTLPDLPPEPLWLVLGAECAATFDTFTRSGADDALVQQGDGSWPNFFRHSRFIPAVEYLQAGRLRQQLIEAMQTLFEEIDVLIAPPWAGHSLLFSNMTGQPCVVVPDGPKTGSNPVSLCFIGRPFEEGAVLAVAQAFQEVSDWHRQRPPGH